ncbi:unnamed protein product [Closterium sp. NIES-53]
MRVTFCPPFLPISIAIWASPSVSRFRTCCNKMGLHVASEFLVRGGLAHVRDITTDKLAARTLLCVFLSFSVGAPDLTSPRPPPPPSPPLFLAPTPPPGPTPPVAPAHLGPAPSVDSGGACTRGAGAGARGTGTVGAGSGGAGAGGAGARGHGAGSTDTKGC